MTLLRGDLAPAPRTLVDILTETAQECPDAAAIDNGRVVLTYSELHDQVTEVAETLAEAGIGRGDRVGVRIKSGTTDLYVAILGIISAGAAYVPVDADDPDEVAHFATRILNESHRLGALVTELIALSRLQGAEKLPELVRVDVDEVLTEALKRVRVPAEAASAAGTEEAPDPRDRFLLDAPSGLEVAGDRTLLVTALSNLLENAVAYSPEGASVSVRRRRQGDRIEISVTDRGIGIAPEHQQRVFERFFRVDPARSRATGGTGLGLAIVKHVAANHGGEVRLWSQPGVGSTFTLRVPAAPPDDADDDLDADDLDADLALTTAGSGPDPAPSATGGTP